MMAVAAFFSWGLESQSFCNRKAVQTQETGIFWQCGEAQDKHPASWKGSLQMAPELSAHVALPKWQWLDIFQRSKAELAQQ